MDVAFVVDRTRSVGVVNFMLLKGFLLQLIGTMHISPDTTHAGVIAFSRKPTLLSTLADTNKHSNKAFHDHILSIPVILGRRTFTDKALRLAAQRFFTEKEGDRPKFPNVLILFTDGRTNVDSRPFNQIIPLLKVRFKLSVVLLFCPDCWLSSPSNKKVNSINQKLSRIYRRLIDNLTARIYGLCCPEANKKGGLNSLN